MLRKFFYATINHVWESAIEIDTTWSSLGFTLHVKSSSNIFSIDRGDGTVDDFTGVTTYNPSHTFSSTPSTVRVMGNSTIFRRLSISNNNITEIRLWENVNFDDILDASECWNLQQIVGLENQSKLSVLHLYDSNNFSMSLWDVSSRSNINRWLSTGNVTPSSNDVKYNAIDWVFLVASKYPSNLTDLDLSNQDISDVNLSWLSSLTSLRLNSTNFSFYNFDLTSITTLQDFSATNAWSFSVDASNLTSLSTLAIWRSNCTSVNVTWCTNLNLFNDLNGNSSYPSLDLTWVTNLGTLYIQDNTTISSITNLTAQPISIIMLHGTSWLSLNLNLGDISHRNIKRILWSANTTPSNNDFKYALFEIGEIGVYPNILRAVRQRSEQIQNVDFSNVTGVLTSIDFNWNQLTSASVTSILTVADANWGTGGFIDISWWTSAIPTASDEIIITSLESKWWTVATN